MSKQFRKAAEHLKIRFAKVNDLSNVLVCRAIPFQLFAEVHQLVDFILNGL